MFRKIVVANDGSEGAARALLVAVETAKAHAADLVMISVEQLPEFPTSVDEVKEEKADANHRFRSLIRRAKAQAEAKGVALSSHVVTGHAVKRIVEFIERESADLLVVGFMGHSALYNRLIGSTTDRLVELASCSVLAVK
jgi:nucleotide-binding universal stress UspA family protein